MKSGRNSGSSNQERFRDLVRQWNERTGPFVMSWKSAKSLFNPGEVAKTLDGSLAQADMRLATSLFVLAAFVTFAIFLVSTLESAELAKYTVETIAGLGGATPVLDLSMLDRVVVYQYTMYVPVALLFLAIHETLVYWIARATGGKGTFARQFYLSSLVALSMMGLSLLYLFIPLPLLDLLAIAGLVIGGFYLVFYVNTRAYARVHGITYFHALAINILVSIPRIAATYLVMDAVAGALGLPTATGLA